LGKTSICCNEFNEMQQQSQSNTTTVKELINFLHG
jgi:hypothetical protein